MDFAQLVPWAVFAGFAFGAWGILNFVSSRRSRTDERLDELRNPMLRGKDREEAQPREAGVGATMMEKAAPALSKALQPKNELEQSKLKVSLANAGFNSPHASEWYLAIKFAALIAGLVAGTGIGLPNWGMTKNSL